MIKTVVYHGENQLGEVEIFLQQNNDNLNLNSNPILLLMREKGIRITHFSPPSERCSPLAVLYTVAADSGFCFKMEPSNKFLHSRDEPTQLSALHAACLGDNKTAVMSLGEVELHLVAMPSRNTSRVPCFWGFAAGIGLYSSCLDLLNLRCLGIVFDLDETLIVANTMRSFEDRIDALQRKMSSEADPQRLAGMVAEVKRYQEDRAILKQYAENDQVIDNGKVLKVQHEVVPALSDNHPSVVRPLIRLPDRNTVLTRINPSIRDTSVLVRLRPAWEDLRSYLTARGRKRFEVYVCTMAERDYALEMWRLLDPDSNLIITSELLDRIVCVKSGFKKSLFNVFHHGNCHPKMALVIDDRLKVWEEKDQSRVHVVPAFAPYYAPLAEANNTIPVLCVARNVACNVRGGFFKDFDDGLLVQISEVLYEDELKNMPCPPDVSNYLVSEDDASIINGNKEPPLTFDGMAGEEVERRLKEAISAAVVSVASYALPVDPNPRVPSGASYPMPVDPNPRIPSVEFTIASPIPVMPAEPAASFPSNQFQQAPTMVRHIGHTGPAEPTLQSSPVREEGEVPESELDPDTRRRLLILQHGMDNTRENVPGEPQFSGRSPVQAPAPGPLPVPTGPAPVPVPVPLPAPPPPPCPASVPMGQSRGHWYEGQMNPGQPGGPMPKEFSLSTDGARLDKQRPVAPPFSRKMDSFNRSERPFVLKARFLKDAQAQRRDERFRSNSSRHSQSYQDEDVPLCRSSSGIDYESESGRLSSTKEDWGSDSGQSSSSGKFFDSEAGQGIPWSETPAGALHDIAVKCGAKVEYSSTLAATTELKFLIEVSFAGQRVGQGSGKTRREAQQKGAEAALRSLADKYLSHLKSDSSITKADANKASNANDNGFFGESNSREISDEPLSGGDRKSQELLSDGSMRSLSSVTALRELCSMEGLGLDIVHQPVSGSAFQKDETCVQVEIEGQVFGRGVGLTWDEAQYQAVEKALAGLRSMLDHTTYKRPGSPRALQGSYGKRMRSDYPRGSFQRMPSSRYPRNASPVP